MTAALRPMNLGEILDRSFQIYRAKFLVFAGLAAIPALAMFSLHCVDISWLHLSSLIHQRDRSGTLAWNYIISLFYYHISSLLGLWIYPASIKLASNVILDEDGTILSSLQFAAARWRSYLWVSVLRVFVVLVIPEILIVTLLLAAIRIVAVAHIVNGGEAFLIFFLLVLLVAGIVLFLWLGTCLSLAVPACAMEGIAGIGALRRSWSLSKGSRLRILFNFLTISISAWLLMYGLQLIIRWAYIFLYRIHPFGPTIQHLYLPAIYLMYAMVSALIHPIYTTALTLFYYDQRIRHEGYDIERMMETAGLNVPETPPSGNGSALPAEAGESQA